MAQERNAEDRGTRRVEEETGLGGPGTEGKPGPPEGGVEPQIPQDVTDPLESEAQLQETARKIAKDLGLDLEK